jgi:phage-related protein
MSNENDTIDDVAGGINAMAGSAGRIVTQQVELVTLAIESVAQLFPPIFKTAADLVTGTINGVNQVIEGASSAIEPEK